MAERGHHAVLSRHPFHGMVRVSGQPARTEGPRVSLDERPVALPKLYGAPAYARPPAPVVPTARPFDPDLLPLQMYQTDEERAVSASLPARRYGSAADLAGDLRPPAEGGSAGGLRPRRFSLRAIAGRLLGEN